ncbi:hypothetical protein A361_16640 [Cytobacillus oceanisediminis 2691]|uniref:Uncharacterized protein n=1 Tax=Cytobacillus oceanisediminis 2691 TaxID=1196031 RepID=A0A160MCN5_9BACI|nr:hypothetical protein A361_16640 [Cytobacillus oceanisediminis 2691]
MNEHIGTMSQIPGLTSDFWPPLNELANKTNSFQSCCLANRPFSSNPLKTSNLITFEILLIKLIDQAYQHLVKFLLIKLFSAFF